MPEKKKRGRPVGSKDKKKRKHQNQAPGTKGLRYRREDAGLWAPLFLASLRNTGVIRESCQKVGISRSMVNDMRHRDEQFAKDFVDAMEDAADLLDTEGRKRARRRSDTMLIFYLKSLKRYQETQRFEITGRDGGPVEHELLESEEKRNFFLAVITALEKKDDATTDAGTAEGVDPGRGAGPAVQSRLGDAVHATNGSAVPPALEPPAGPAGRGV
jgi:hypothetical protein